MRDLSPNDKTKLSMNIQQKATDNKVIKGASDFKIGKVQNIVPLLIGGALGSLVSNPGLQTKLSENAMERIKDR